jgi:hypothetical protein
VLSRLSREDGLYWRRYSPDTPWHSFAYVGGDQSSSADYSAGGANGVLLRALLTWRELDSDDRWDDAIRGLIDGIDHIAVHAGDYAYFPANAANGGFVYRGEGWGEDAHEPMHAHEGSEGDMLHIQGEAVQGLARWYAATGDEKALRLARKFVHFTMERRYWGGEPEPLGVAGDEHGHVDSHFTSRLMALRALLEFGVVADDERVKEFVRASYEYMRGFAIPRLGFIDGFHTSKAIAGYTEGCMLGLWVALGIRMSDAGIGDFWDDVDHCVRNQLIEQQLTDKMLLEKVVAEGFERPPGSPWIWLNGYERFQLHPGQESVDNVVERSLGLWGAFSTPTHLPNLWVMQCCSGNAPWGLYAAWEGTVRSHGADAAQVNLLLNHASPWLDVESSLPYEGKVVIRNKTTRRISVRVAAWIRRNEIRCDVDGTPRNPDLIGNYLVFDDLTPGATITVRFPISESSAEYTILARRMFSEKKYNCKFRGSTLVDISPREDPIGAYPIYRRDHLQGEQPAPTRVVERRVAERRVVAW